MQHPNWKCLRCNHDEFEMDQMRATGGMFAKIFDVQNKHFLTVSCQRCGHTELYRASRSSLSDVFDFFTQ